MGRTDVAERLIHAPLERTFAALVTPEDLQAWLPPHDMSARFEHADIRSGGSYRMVLTYARAGSGKTTGDTDVVAARVIELVPGERLVQAIDFDADDPAFTGTMTMTWSVRAADSGTVVELRAEDVPPGISAEDHASGLASSLDNLAAHLETPCR